MEIDPQKLNVSLNINVYIGHADQLGQADRPSTPKARANGLKSGIPHYLE